MKNFIFFLILSLILGCKTDNSINTENLQISVEILNKFNEIFGETIILGEKREFKRGYYLSNPKLDVQRLDKADFSYMYFELIDNKEEHIFVSVSQVSCFVSIVSEFNGFIYPNNSSIYPIDLAFLSEYLANDYSCTNSDDMSFREINFDKRLIGQWKVDSVLNREHTKDPNFENISFEFRDNEFIYENKIHLFTQQGLEISIPSFPFLFYKIYLGSKNMILINFFENEYQEFYFTKH